MLSRITFAMFLAATTLCTNSCSTSPPPLPPDPSKVPGYDQYFKALEAYRDFEYVVDQEERQQSTSARDALSYKETIERKKREYLAIAVENLEMALELNPDFAHAHMLMGAVCFVNKKHENALAEFGEVLRIYPVADNAWVNIALVYRRQGKMKEAHKALEEALSINPQSIRASRLFQLIKEEEQGCEKGSMPQFHPRLGM